MTFEIESKEDKNRRFVDEIYQIITTLNHTIVKANEQADQRKDQMKSKITQKIPKLKASVEEFAAEVMSEDLLEISSNLAETLAKVERMDTLCATLT